MTRQPLDLDARYRAKVAAEREAAGLAAAPGVADAAEPGAGDMAKKPKPKPATSPRKGDRWQTLNQFVDVIAPHLSGAEVRVWLFMFRHARGGMVELSERAMAKAVGVSKETAGIALRRLVAAGLVWEVFKSGFAGAASKYGLRPNPASKLATVEGMQKSDKRACNRVPNKRKKAGGFSAR
jgi:hypothetical protein